MGHLAGEADRPGVLGEGGGEGLRVAPVEGCFGLLDNALDGFHAGTLQPQVRLRSSASFRRATDEPARFAPPERRPQPARKPRRTLHPPRPPNTDRRPNKPPACTPGTTSRD